MAADPPTRINSTSAVASKPDERFKGGHSWAIEVLVSGRRQIVEAFEAEEIAVRRITLNFPAAAFDRRPESMLSADGEPCNKV